MKFRGGTGPYLLALTVAVLFFGSGGFWSATWASKWALLITVDLVLAALVIAVRINVWHAPLIVYAVSSLLESALWAPMSSWGPTASLAIQRNALVGLFELSALISVVSMARDRRAEPYTFFALVGVWLAGICCQMTPENGHWFGNPSMGAGLLACLVPFCWSSELEGSWRWANRGLTWLGTLGVILITGTSIPWGVLAVVTVAFAVVATSGKPWQPLWGLFILPLGLLGRLLLGTEFTNPNGRPEIWRMAWDWARLPGPLWGRVPTSIVWGAGFGTGQIEYALQQTVTGHFHGDYFLWLHSDWLQILLEGGAVGLACALLSLGRLLWVSRRGPQVFASLCGFAALGLFNYPLRMPIHCLCLALVAGLAEASGRNA